MEKRMDALVTDDRIKMVLQSSSFTFSYLRAWRAYENSVVATKWMPVSVAPKWRERERVSRGNSGSVLVFGVGSLLWVNLRS